MPSAVSNQQPTSGKALGEVDNSKLVPLLWNAVQELSAQVVELEHRLADSMNQPHFNTATERHTADRGLQRSSEQAMPAALFAVFAAQFRSQLHHLCRELLHRCPQERDKL